MDNMSPRTNRPAQRPIESIQSAHAGKSHAGASANHGRVAKSKKPMMVIGIVLALVLVGLAAWFALGRTGSAGAIDDSKYQAVFFTNGQVYFGKLSQLDGDYMRLKNVYYLQNKEQAADETTPQSASKQDASDVELIKLGNEIHGPEDEMLVSKDQILFFENLKPAGTVSQTISNFQKSNQ